MGTPLTFSGNSIEKDLFYQLSSNTHNFLIDALNNNHPDIINMVVRVVDDFHPEGETRWRQFAIITWLRDNFNLNIQHGKKVADVIKTKFVCHPGYKHNPNPKWILYV